MFNLCLFSSYVMPGEQRTRSWLTSLYNKDTVIDSFVETNDKIRQNTWWSPNTYFWKYSVIKFLNGQGLIPVVQCTFICME